MNSAYLQGCCHGKNFYDIGTAHLKPKSKTQYDFNLKLYRCSASGINIAITNMEQAQERKYLENEGWETKKVGDLWVSSISGTDFRVNQNKFNAEKAKKAREIKEAPTKVLVATSTASMFGRSASVKQKVTLREIDDLIQMVTRRLGMRIARFGNLTTDRRRAVIEEVSKTYGIVYPVGFVGTMWWTNESLHRSIVSKLSRK